MKSKMIDSILNMLASPQVGSEVSIESSRNSSSFSEANNSTISDMDEPNLSPFLKRNIDAINLDDPGTQEVALRYLLGKVRDMESLLFKTIKSNKDLDDEVTKLYKQNDALSAENLTLQESITALKNDNANLSSQVSDLREFLNSEREKFVRIISINAKNMSEDVKTLEEDVDYLGELIPVTKELVNRMREIQEDICQLNSEVARVDSEVERVDTEISRVESAVNRVETDVLRVDTDLDRIDTEFASEIIRIDDNITDQIKEIDDHIDLLEKVIIRTEKEVVVTNQYNRRQNLIIDGIPDHVPQKRLENVCVDIIRELGFIGRLGSYEIIGCHRLKKKASDVTTPVIIRFFNRKITEFCMKNRRNLRNTRSTWNL